MEKAAIGTNNFGMHIVIRPISKDFLSKDETVGIETQKINSLLTARRPIALADAISALPPLLPPSADPITGRRLYSIEEIMPVHAVYTLDRLFLNCSDMRPS